jgi:uncharacterized protein (TIGR00725 family)
MVAVIGDANLKPSERKAKIAREVGRLLVESGCRVVTGGLGGVMAAAMEGARCAENYSDGDTIGVLPGFDPDEASPAADIVLATGLSLARNILVANADAVIAIGGGAGTLSEIALAWQLRRPIIGILVTGWSKNLASVRLDCRQRQVGLTNDRIYPAGTPVEAVRLAIKLIPRFSKRKGAVN